MLFSVLWANLLLCPPQLQSFFAITGGSLDKHCDKNVHQSCLGPSRERSLRQILTFPVNWLYLKSSVKTIHALLSHYSMGIVRVDCLKRAGKKPGGDRDCLEVTAKGSHSLNCTPVISSYLGLQLAVRLVWIVPKLANTIFLYVRCALCLWVHEKGSASQSTGPAAPEILWHPSWNFIYSKCECSATETQKQHLMKPSFMWLSQQQCWLEQISHSRLWKSRSHHLSGQILSFLSGNIQSWSCWEKLTGGLWD